MSQRLSSWHAPIQLEFELLPLPLSRIAYPVFDREGRACGEGNTSGATMELARCPYPGHRKELPMNVSALRQVTQYWRDVLPWISALRQEYLARERRSTFNLSELWRFAKALAAAPAYLARRARQPIENGELSPRIAVLFKLVQGINLTINHLVDPGGARFCGEVPEGFVAWAEDHALFRSDSGRVCSGPSGMIDTFLDAFFDPRAVSMPENPEANEDLEDVRASLDYGRSIATLELCLWLFATQNELILARYEEVLSAGRDAFHEAVETVTRVAPRDTDRLVLHPSPARARELVPDLGACLRDWLHREAPGTDLMPFERLFAEPGALASIEDIEGDYGELEKAALAAFTLIQHRVAAARGGSEPQAITAQQLVAIHPRCLRSVLDACPDV
ncbi:MAG: hypothetical protein WBV82_23130 [Myxococcaceae bacterium]